MTPPRPPSCRECGRQMKPGKALLNTVVGFPDFAGDTGREVGCTLSRMGPAQLVPVWKCPHCGHSVTMGEEPK